MILKRKKFFEKSDYQIEKIKKKLIFLQKINQWHGNLLYIYKAAENETKENPKNFGANFVGINLLNPAGENRRFCSERSQKR